MKILKFKTFFLALILGISMSASSYAASELDSVEVQILDIELDAEIADLEVSLEGLDGALGPRCRRKCRRQKRRTVRRRCNRKFGKKRRRCIRKAKKKLRKCLKRCRK